MTANCVYLNLNMSCIVGSVKLKQALQGWISAIVSTSLRLFSFLIPLVNLEGFPAGAIIVG